MITSEQILRELARRHGAWAPETLEAAKRYLNMGHLRRVFFWAHAKRTGDMETAVAVALAHAVENKLVEVQLP